MSTTHNKSILETSASLAMTPPVALSLSPAFRNWRRTPKKKAAGSLEPTILRPSPGSKIPVVAVVFHFPLVGGWPTPLKILVGGKDYPTWKIKNVPNHQPVQCFTTWCTVCVCVPCSIWGCKGWPCWTTNRCITCIIPDTEDTTKSPSPRVIWPPSLFIC